MTVLRCVLLFALGRPGRDRRGLAAWGVLVDGVRPDRDLLGAVLCLAAVAVIMDASRAS
jgi:hypothetical protein